MSNNGVTAETVLSPLESRSRPSFKVYRYIKIYIYYFIYTCTCVCEGVPVALSRMSPLMDFVSVSRRTLLGLSYNNAV